MLPASAIPVIFGVESFAADELDNEFGASGAVVSGSPIEPSSSKSCWKDSSIL